jgi:glycyl-tRNA synthetase beta chain
MNADLLIELGCEELPPKALDDIRDALFSGVCDGLARAQIAFDPDHSRAYSSPRRLAVIIARVADAQPSQQLERKGPAVQAAFDGEGNPTPAALGFARSVGRRVDELDRLKTDKGEWLYAKIHQQGRSLDELLYPILQQAIKQLPVPKPMRWSDHDFSFVRPVHWLVALHGNRVLDGELLGQTAGRTTRGHRIHSPGPHRIEQAGDYLDVLRKSNVLADQVERKQAISQMVSEADSNARIDPNLLNEVNNLVEWPVAVVCGFEEEFLEVPHEALIASMQDHQKFFPVGSAGAGDAVTNRFIAVSNVDSQDFAVVREGYERVIRPRLADARFFLEQDLKHGLERYLPQLDRVIFQEKIGTIGDKSRRIKSISEQLAEKLSLDSTDCGRAAELSKCDLLSHMVGEFPELQGRMGMHYALAAGEAPQVAEAIGEHYAPRFAGDDIPVTAIGRVVSLADRLDTLVAIFSAGLKPTGNRDPFALRRAALGLCRILLEAGIGLSLDDLLELAAGELGQSMDSAIDNTAEVREFIVDRLRNHYREQGFTTELVSAALASPWSTLPDLDRRIRAISGFMDSEEAQSLAAANKRIGNILRKSEDVISEKIDQDILVLEAEKRLFDEIKKIENSLDELLQQQGYRAALENLADLRSPVDQFFDTVMVMDEDQNIRINRLSLLARMKALFDQIGDLSVLG